MGALLAGGFFWSIKDKAEAKTTPVLYAYQVGVFKNKENASIFQQNFEAAKIVKDQEIYRVFIGITISNKELLQTIFDSSLYTYYLKEIPVPLNVYEEVQKYDVILAHASLDNQKSIVRTMLGILPDEL